MPSETLCPWAKNAIHGIRAGFPLPKLTSISESSVLWWVVANAELAWTTLCQKP